jgi:UDP-4-amino-4,6-dideoxy-N-acetyl-beta-L-altrosamine transaminase
MTIPYGRQSISEEDIQAVIDVLRSDYLTQGPAVPRFEEAINGWCGSKYSIAVNSATSALHIACLALGVGVGDRVWTSAITFVASANCAHYCGASVDFVDVDDDTYNMSIEHLEEKLVAANKLGTLPKVVIPVHLAGQSCDMEAIKRLSKMYGFRIIEDASHAIGASYKGIPVGGCSYSDVTVFSFHPVKIITTGEGGVATTNDQELAARMALLRSHGVTRDPDQMVHPPHGPWYYEQITLGFNYRLTDISAALGISQLRRLSNFVDERHRIAHRYNELFSGHPVRSPWQHPDTRSSFHLYIIRPDLARLQATHREIFERLRSRGILANLHYIPVYRQPYYASKGYSRSEFPNAEKYYSEAISLPIYPGLTDDEQDRVVTALLEPRGHQTLF